MKLWLAYVRFATDRPLVPLAIGLVLAILASFGARHVEVDASLEALLPEDSPTLEDMDLLRARVAGTTPLRLIVTSDDAALNRALAATLAERVAAWPEARVAFAERDPSYLVERRLLFLPESELRSLADDLEDRLEWERCERTPGCVNFESRPEVPTEEALRERWSTLPEAQALARLFGEGFVGTDSQDTDSQDTEEDARAGTLCSDDGRVCGVIAVLDGDPRELDHATEIVARAEALFAELEADVTAPAAGLRMLVDGVYRNTALVKRGVEGDLLRTSVVGLLLLVLVLVVQFRAIRAVPFLLVPCGVGILWTLGLVGASHPTLNLISAFVLAILAGIGVDFGVHLLTFYGRVRAERASVPEALERTARELAPAMLAAGLTTLCGFLALSAARFRGLSELGPIAALGISLTLLAFALLFPSLVAATHYVASRRETLLRVIPKLRPLRYREATARTVVSLGLTLAAGLGALGLGLVGPGVTLETGTASLESPDVRHDVDADAAFRGAARSLPAENVVLLAEDPDALRVAVADLRARDEETVPLEEALLLEPETFFPRDADARLAQVERLAEIAGDLLARADEPPAALRSLHTLAEGTTAVTLEGLPSWLREQFIERDGTFGRLAVLFVDMDGADSLAMAELTEAMNRWREAHPHVAFSSTHAVLGEVIPTLERDGPRMLAIAALGVLFALAFLARSMRRAILVLAPLLVSTACTGGAMVLAGIELNMFNLLVVPVGFGIAIDGAIYVAWHLGDGRGERARATFRAVLFSTLTTLTAFGCLVLASHPGLESIGWLALLAMAISTLVNLVWLPALVVLLRVPDDRPTSVETETPDAVVS